MNRLTLAVAAAGASALGAIAMTFASPVPPLPKNEPAPAVDPQGPVASSPAATNLAIWMSDVENGDRVHSVISTTNRVWAVVDYEEAASERYDVVLRDLSGIIVKRGAAAADGTGRSSVPIAVTDFVDTYRAVLDPSRESDGVCLSEACVMKRSLEDAQFNCQSAPPAPPEWPEPPRPTVPPGVATPTPDPTDPYPPYRAWLDSTLGLTSTGRQAMTEVTRTLQAFITLPDARSNTRIAANVNESQAALVGAFDVLGRVERQLSPPSGRPDVAAGCRLVDDAARAVDMMVSSWSQVQAELGNVAAWRLPPTGARWSGQRFQGCIQYQTDLFAVIGGSPEPAPRLSARWSVGEPSAPRLIFPGPELVDRGSEGSLGVTLPPGAEAIYAKSVTAPGANHEAIITAYVTDRSCIPVSGVDMSFNVNPLEAGTVTPGTVTVEDGLATARLEAGQDAQNRGAVVGSVEAGGPGPSPGAISAQAAFRVIGVADPNFITFLMRQGRLINYARGDTLNFSVQARDEFGRDVADGTEVQLSVPPADPAQMAYFRRSMAPAPPQQPTPTPELVMLGRELVLYTRDGMTVLPESQDPGFRHLGPVLACTGEGGVTLSALVDGATANTNDEHGLKTIRCQARHTVHLPQAHKKYDRAATRRPPVPIETSTPTATP